MNGGSRIVAVGPGQSPDDTLAETATATEEVIAAPEELLVEDELPAGRSLAWLAPALALAAIIAWSGLFVFAHRAAMLDGVTPQEASSWISTWAVPVALMVGLLLLAMRSSRREAARFGEVSRMLSDESAQLETRLVTVNRELSLARDFIAAQSRDLESLGRVASERLSENAERMSAMIHTNSKQIDSIASVSTTALENMDKLRNDLPVVANSARDLTSQIGNAGRTAQSQIEELIKGLHRVNSFGEAGTKLIDGLQDKVDVALTNFENRAKALGDTSIKVIVSLGQRIAALEAECQSFTRSIHEGEGEALEKWSASIETMRATLGDALREIAEIDAGALESTRQRLESVGEWARQVDASLDERAAGFVEALDARREAQAQRELEEAQALAQRLASLDFGNRRPAGSPSCQGCELRPAR